MMKAAGWAAAAAQTTNAIDSENSNRRLSGREVAWRPRSAVAHAISALLNLPFMRSDVLDFVSRPSH
jgi:hypothetical protein